MIRTPYLALFGAIGVVLLGCNSPAAAADPETVRLQIDPTTKIAAISPSFIGLGYETSAVAQHDFFSVKNARMLVLYRNLSSHGLIRIGGNVSDHTQYVADGTAAAHSERETTTINRQSLTDLGEFARTSGWKVMWGLNLGTGSREQAVEEAVAVDSGLGSHLQSFQIGNEVELLSRFKHNYSDYHAAYLDWKSAIRAALPGAAFSGPDSIGTLSWITNFADSESSDMKLLTQHYYRGGAKDRTSTLEKLLSPDTAWITRLGKLQQICQEHKIAFRINETNSFYGGGKAGVSDTFGSALWCLDYMFLIASHGGDGVNMETDINQLGFISHYSPIVHDEKGVCSARPEYYGMLAFAMAGHGDVVKLTVDNATMNLTAYATVDDRHQLWVTAINKDLATDATVEFGLPEGYRNSEAFALVAPAIQSKDHVTFAGNEVGGDGAFSAGAGEKVECENATARVALPHGSAVVIRLTP